MDKVGIDEVRRMVDEELEGEWVAERDIDADLVTRLSYDDDEQANAPKAPATKVAQR